MICISINRLGNIERQRYDLYKYNQWGIFPVREIRGFPILLSRSGEKCQNLSRSGNKMINFICLSRSTDCSDDFTSQILNELSRISPTGILLNWVVFEKYVLKVCSFLAQLGIFTTFPFRAAYFLNSKVVIILFFQFLCEKAGKIYSLFSVLF